MKRTSQILTVVVAFAAVPGFSGHDSPYPQDYFESPLEIPLLLSGSFAELRSNHFHSGIDIKTQDREGHMVAASADGWVSRVKVSAVGYGNALYIDHPNGYTTVYAHLQGFREDIAEYVKDLQYSKKRFSIDVRPEKGKFAVEKGKEIARSGNSGGSTGPHLHFEVRRTRNSNPLNPQAFGITVNDSTPPRIFRIKVYPAEPGSYVRAYSAGSTNERTATYGQSLVLGVRGAGNSWSLSDADNLVVHGAVKFSIQTHDYHEGSRSRLGATRVALTANDEMLFESQIEEFSFGQTRYLNAHIDYEERQRNRRWFHRNHLLPGNRLPFYNGVNDGVLHVEDGVSYDMKYEILDIRGNTSTLGFPIRGVADEMDLPGTGKDAVISLPYGQDGTLSRSGIRLSIPAGALYDDVDLTYERTAPVDGAFADVHSVHDPLTPVHNRMTVSILANQLPVHLRSKAVVAGVSDRGNLYSLGGEYAGGYVSSRVRSFGRFTIAADTTSPTIRSLNLVENMSERSSIRIKATDDLSGIASFNGYIDGEWVLFEHDSKRNLFYHRFDERTDPGPHSLKLVAVDNKGNEALLERTFAR
ncbi:MAG: M23 family metallopeptidase [Rhodothermales bacterium]|nr:M23 family metallopeptidase [Rhodothermales bacterium]